MNKTLMFLGMLAVVGFANAQQKDPYEGKVGINIDQPSATLNVKSMVDNGKNLELENHSGTKLVTVLDNNYVGINNTTPVAPLHIISPNTGLGNDIIIEDYNSRTDVNYDSSALIFNRNRGTLARPEKLKLNDIVGQIIFSTKEGTIDNLAGNRMSEIGSDYKGLQKGNFYIKTSNMFRVFIDENGNIGMGITTPSNKLHIKADSNPLKLEGLQPATGTDNKSLVVDANGVVKIGSTTASTGATQVGTGEQSMPCNDDNRGKMNFQRDIALSGGGTVDAFAVCLKGSDGKHYWRYLYGSAGVSNLTGNFGENLPK